MSIEAQESSGIGSDDGGDFECNICFELAADPIITVCGHLYCWPCLYKWLRLHSRSQGCPVCQALIREEKLIPLYGRGKIPTDPRSKPVPGVEIPSRPAGQRPETAPSLEASNISNLVFRFIPAFSPNFSIQVHRFSNTGEYDATQGYHHRYSRPFRGPEGEIVDRESNNVREADGILKRIHFVVFVLALFALLLL